MVKFQDAYQEAYKELPGLDLDAEKVQDELHHRKMQQRERKVLITRGCTAAAVLFLCGAGTAAAKTYGGSYIRISDTGCTITSRSADQDTQDDIKGRKTEDDLSKERILKMGGGLSTLDAGVEILEGETVDYIECESMEYDSIENFLAASGIKVPLPDTNLFDVDFTDENVQTSEDGRKVFISLSNEEAYFCLSQMDNREYECYSTAAAFGGQSCNERSFTNRQGISYVVFDTVDTEGGIISVHAVVSMEGRDLCISFHGFDEEVIEKVLYEMDLSVYFGGE